MGCFMGGEGTVKIDWSRYNSILCKLGFDGSFRELICSHGFEPTFECESLVGLYLPYEKHPYGTEDLLSDLKPYVEPGSWFRWEYEAARLKLRISAIRSFLQRPLPTMEKSRSRTSIHVLYMRLWRHLRVWALVLLNRLTNRARCLIRWSLSI